jgi:hypothetical protein
MPKYCDILHKIIIRYVTGETDDEARIIYQEYECGGFDYHDERPTPKEARAECERLNKEIGA